MKHMSTISCRWRRRGLRTMWTNRKNVWEQKKRREWGMNMCSAWFLKHLDKLRRIWLSKVFFKVKLILSINWYLELIWDIYVDTWGGNTFTNLCDLRLYRHSVEQGGCCHVDSTQSFSQRASQWSDVVLSHHSHLFSVRVGGIHAGHFELVHLH